MFRIVDRYVLWQFLQFYVICFLSLAGLYIVIDAFGRLDHFVDHAKETGGSFLALMGQYYGYKALAFFNQTSGILALTAAMFTVTWAQRYNEMTALLAAGVPRLRVLRPVILAAITVSFGAAAIREFVIPEIRHELAADTKNLSGDAEQPITARWDNESDIFLSGEAALLGEQKIIKPGFKLPPELAIYGKRLTAESADYIGGDAQDSDDDSPRGYWLRGVNEPQGLLTNGSLRNREQQVVVASPADTPWLAEDEVFVVSNVPFELLASGGSWRDLASTSELVAGLKSPSVELSADVSVAVHRRLLSPVMDITLLFLGLPLVVSRGARNPFIAIGLAMLVVTGFFVVTLGSQSLGASDWLRPSLAAWAPLLVFVPVAAGLSDQLQQ